MTALNFPSSPNNGDTYQGYVYDSTYGVWNKDPQQIVSRFVASETAPTPATEGDGWFETSTGKTYIYYDGYWVESGYPVFGYQTVEGLSDTNITTPSDGQVLSYDSASEEWINESLPAIPSAIDDLADVTIDGTPSDNEVLAYDSGSGEWINQTPAEAGIAEASHTHTASDITDLSTYVADNSAPKLLIETSEQTASYTLAAGDINKVVLMNGTDLTLTVPTNASVAFSVGTVINVYNINSTDLTIAGDSGVTVRNAGALAQYDEVSLRKRGTDEWVLIGNIA